MSLTPRLALCDQWALSKYVLNKLVKEVVLISGKNLEPGDVTPILPWPFEK